MDLRGTMRVNDRGILEIGGCEATRLAVDFGTPLYVMDEEDIRERCRKAQAAFSRTFPDTLVAYASKAFCTMAMCRLACQEGLGLDVSSGGELYTAIQSGFPADRILFHGNNKTREEVEMGVRAGVSRFVVDNLHELDLLADMARRFRRRVHVQIRLTPGIDAHTHEYIATGRADSKFGFGVGNGQAIAAVRSILATDSVVLDGVHCHIGSQILSSEPFAAAAAAVIDFMAEIKKVCGYTVREANLGGGVGIRYNAGDERLCFARYAAAVSKAVRDRCAVHGLDCPRLMVEPGRYIVGEAGTTLYTIGSIKTIPGIRRYAAVDGGLSDNPRVALYQAEYEAIVANRASAEPSETVTIAGKHCESGDVLIRDISLPATRPGDILAVLSTGAYNYSMSSNYNRLPRPAVVFVRAGAADLVVEREAYSDVVVGDRLPARFEAAGEVVSCADTA